MGRPSDPNAKIDLLRAAEAEFLARGLDHAKVEDIAVRAGRSKGAFYLHFASKEDAFRQIVESMLARLAATLDDGGIFDPGGIFTREDLGLAGGPQVLAAWLDKDVQIFEFVWHNRRVFRMLLEGGRSATFGYLIDEFAERTRSNTVRFLAWGVRQGFFRADLDVDLASLVISGAYDRVARHLVRSDGQIDLRPQCAKVQRLVLGAISSPAFAALVDSQVRNWNPAPLPGIEVPGPRRPRTAGTRSR
ncbi:MAG: TetR/AcrR family transcriptional regulator [Myxococcales bacterium]|nr:TetR/AcrR family transcriptional regulator [Myxococcales bacterium]